MAFFFDFQYGFRSSQSTADLLTVVSDRIARAFKRSGATRAVIYPRLLTGFSMLVYFTNLSLMEFQVRYLALFLLFSVIDNFEWFLDGKSSQEYLVNAGVLQGSILGPTLFLRYINDLPDHVSCIIAIYADDTILSVIRHLICGNNLNWLLNLNLIYKTVWTGLFQLVLFDRSNNNGSIDVKMDGSTPSHITCCHRQ